MPASLLPTSRRVCEKWGTPFSGGAGEQQVPPLRRSLRYAQGPAAVGMTGYWLGRKVESQNQRQRQRTGVSDLHGQGQRSGRGVRFSSRFFHRGDVQMSHLCEMGSGYSGWCGFTNLGGMDV